MIAHFTLNNQSIDSDFEKIKTLRKVKTKKGTEDYEVYFDNMDNCVLLSNITTLEDHSGNVYCGNILNVLKNYVV